MIEDQYVKSLYEKRGRLKRMLKMLKTIMEFQEEKNPIFERAKEQLEVDILLLKLELNTMYCSE